MTDAADEQETMMRYGFEALTDGQWTMEAAGMQDASNLFASRAAAEAELPRLAQALDCGIEEVRVVEVQAATRRVVWVVCSRHSGSSGTRYVPYGTLRQAAHRSRANALREALRAGAASSSDLKVRRQLVAQVIWEECQP